MPRTAVSVPSLYAAWPPGLTEQDMRNETRKHLCVRLSSRLLFGAAQTMQSCQTSMGWRFETMRCEYCYRFVTKQLNWRLPFFRRRVGTSRFRFAQMGLELLEYLNPLSSRLTPIDTSPNDTWWSRTVIIDGVRAPTQFFDPDHHGVLLK